MNSVKLRVCSFVVVKDGGGRVSFALSCNTLCLALIPGYRPGHNQMGRNLYSAQCACTVSIVLSERHQTC